MIDPGSIINRFPGCRVLVLGDAILDVYERGMTDRLCREAPAPVVMLEERIFSCGGAANTAVNAAALGGSVSLLSVVGDDEHGERLTRTLRDKNVDCDLVVRDPQRRTIAKKRVCAASSILVRVDEGDAGLLQERTMNRVAEVLRENADRFDVIIVSDYECGVLSDALIERMAKIKLAPPVVVDAKRPYRFQKLSPVIVKPNYEESIGMLGIERKVHGDRVEQMLGHGKRMLESTGAQAVACTLDMDGTILFERSKTPYLISCVPRHDARTIGAGDSFVSALALGVAAKAPLRQAARIAATAAALVLETDGTGICSATELRAHFDGHAKRVDDYASLVERVEAMRRQRKRIVFTNGCFDLLHRGHVEFLQQARALGDALIVALNDDAGIRRIKGEGRPVNALEDRMQVLAGLEAVDLLVAFPDDSPVELLRKIRPDVLAKGGTYSVDSLPEANEIRKLGGEIEIIPFHGNLSTSQLIHRIQQNGGNLAAYGNDRRAL